jgi:protein-S-isoprenylcysteine O-methyltransferase Ste14
VDTARYVVALLAVSAFPAAMLFWVLVHPFVRFWRRLGLVASYVVLFGVFFAVIGTVFALRGRLLAVEFGTNWVFVVVSAVLFTGGMVVQSLAHRQLSFAIFIGVPELGPSGKEGRLLRDGIYAHVRHPRYLAVMLGTAAMALFTNYLAAYALAAITFPWLYLITALEERELLDRFGDQYRGYKQQVPRLIPRLGTSR